MALQKQDELNNLAIPYDRYFGEMGLSEEEIERRIRLAETLDDVFILLFLLISADLALGNRIDKNYYIDYLVRNYEDAIVEFGIDIQEEYPGIPAHIVDTAQEVIEQIFDDPDEEWNLSDDRAQLIAENETNSICEYTVFQDAVKSGKTQKTWNTMVDAKVRHTHADLESLTIPIMETFKVGNYEMYQPKDTSLGAGMEEIANCRCWCSYL